MNLLIKKHLYNLKQIIAYANTKSFDSNLKSLDLHYRSHALAGATVS